MQPGGWRHRKPRRGRKSLRFRQPQHGRKGDDDENGAETRTEPPAGPGNALCRRHAFRCESGVRQPIRGRGHHREPHLWRRHSGGEFCPPGRRGLQALRNRRTGLRSRERHRSARRHSGPDVVHLREPDLAGPERSVGLPRSGRQLRRGGVLLRSRCAGGRGQARLSAPGGCESEHRGDQRLPHRRALRKPCQPDRSAIHGGVSRRLLLGRERGRRNADRIRLTGVRGRGDAGDERRAAGGVDRRDRQTTGLLGSGGRPRSVHASPAGCALRKG